MSALTAWLEAVLADRPDHQPAAARRIADVLAAGGGPNDV